jgi:hypothetical protein
MGQPVDISENAMKLIQDESYQNMLEVLTDRQTSE